MKEKNIDLGIKRNTTSTAANILAAVFCITCRTYLQIVFGPLSKGSTSSRNKIQRTYIKTQMQSFS